MVARVKVFRGATRIVELNAVPPKTTEVQLSCLVELSKDGEPPTEFRLFLAGANRTQKGTILFTARSQREVMERFAEQGTEKVIDYNHASNLPAWAVQDPAAAGKAAGWHRIEVRDGQLWAVGVSWSPAATTGLKNREWRYCSPTVRLTDDGEIVEYVNCAITNTPATHGAPPLMASQHQPSETFMNHKQLCALLGLSETATEAEVQAELAKGRAAQATVTQFTALAGTADTSEALGKLKAAQMESTKVAELAAANAKLEADKRDGELNAVIAEGEREGKITPATREAMLAIGKADLPQLKSLLKGLSRQVPTPAAEPKMPQLNTSQLSADETAVANLMNLSVDDMLAAKKVTGAKVLTAPRNDPDDKK